MLNVFEGEHVYGKEYVDKEAPRHFNSKELACLNTEIPGEVFLGKYGLSCKLYINGSTRSFFCKSLDLRSTATEGQFFDVTKCLVATLVKESSGEEKVRIIVDDDSLLKLYHSYIE